MKGGDRWRGDRQMQSAEVEGRLVPGEMGGSTGWPGSEDDRST